jgi:hypothetical protein
MISTNFWKYSPGGALSADGRFQVASIDRNTYMFRDGGKVFYLPCEQFELKGTPTVAFDLTAPLKFISADGPGALALSEMPDLTEILKESCSVIGREAVFD